MPLVGHPDPPARNAKLQALAATVLPPVDKEQAAKLARAVTSGSTTQAIDVTILWIGKHLMLAHYLGGSFYAGMLGGTGYDPQTVKLLPLGERHYSGDIGARLAEVAKDVVAPGVSDAKVNLSEFWKGGKGKRLTAEVLVGLVGNAISIDFLYPTVVKMVEEERDAESAKQDAKDKRERLAKKQHAADRREAKRIAKLLLTDPDQNLNVADLAKLVIKRGLA